MITTIRRVLRAWCECGCDDCAQGKHCHRRSDGCY